MRRRFVHQQQPRLRHERAGQRDAHAHAAGELAGTGVFEALKADLCEGGVDLRRGAGAIEAAQAQREEDVVGGRGPGE